MSIAVGILVFGLMLFGLGITLYSMVKKVGK
jgi:hypothetical protein